MLFRLIAAVCYFILGKPQFCVRSIYHAIVTIIASCQNAGWKFSFMLALNQIHDKYSPWKTLQDKKKKKKKRSNDNDEEIGKIKGERHKRRWIPVFRLFLNFCALKNQFYTNNMPLSKTSSFTLVLDWFQLFITLWTCVRNIKKNGTSW